MLSFRRAHRHRARRDLSLVLHRQAPARARAGASPGHRGGDFLAPVPAQSRHAAGRDAAAGLPLVQVRRRAARAADLSVGERSRILGRYSVRVRARPTHAQHAGRAPARAPRRARGACGCAGRGAVPRLFHRRRRSWRSGAAPRACRARRPRACGTRRFLAGEDGLADMLAEDRAARRIGINAVPCFIFESATRSRARKSPNSSCPCSIWC